MNYQEFENCAFNQFMKLFSGKWKPLILFHFFESGDMRFTELWRIMPVVSKKVLLEQLKELEEDGIVRRKQVNTFPPEVYYGLTEKGSSLAPLMLSIEKWMESSSN
ncbi:putative HTH-type transcriptional regulator YybR [Elizabethkingia miricola]|nr:putative HTH-type transcriptional regulator YybR [Elizabethkingia miricola]